MDFRAKDWRRKITTVYLGFVCLGDLFNGLYFFTTIRGDYFFGTFSKHNRRVAKSTTNPWNSDCFGVWSVITLRQTNITIKNGPLEDVFPIENGDVPASYVTSPEGSVFPTRRRLVYHGDRVRPLTGAVLLP